MIKMSHEKVKLGVVLFLGIGLSGLHAQETIVSTGSNASGSGGMVSYSVGQVIYTTNTGTNGSELQGVQQAYEIFTVGIKDEITTNISLTIFPNPTTDNITLKVQDFKGEKLIYQVFDTQGKLLTNNQITSSQTEINMNNLPRSAYFINVLQENKKIQLFKIIKN